MLSHGILLFFLSLITLGIEERTLVLFDHEIYTMPSWSYTVLGTIAGTMCILFMAATFYKRLADKINHIIKGPFGPTYWTVFWLVYTTGWLKGLANIPQHEFTYHLIVWVGFVWFIIITVTCFKSLLKFFKWCREFSYGREK